MTDLAQDVIAKLKKEETRLQRFFSTLTDNDWSMQVYEAEMGWKVREILAHMVSTERAFQWLITQAVEGKEGVGSDFDIDNFNQAESAHYVSYTNDQLLEMFHEVREESCALVDNLKADDFKVMSFHPWYGEISVEELLTFILGHNLQHIRDIRKVLRAGEPISSDSF